MEDQVTEYKLKGRFIMHKPARNGSKIEAMNPNAEFVTDHSKDIKAAAIRVANAKAAAAAKKRNK